MDPAEFRADNPYAAFGDLAIAAPADQRLAFIRKTYTHLAAAIYAFAAIEYLLFSLGLDQTMLKALGQSPYSWLIVMGAFVAVSWIADSWARNSTSIGKQYAGLFLYVVAEAVVFLPMLALAKGYTMTVQGIGDVPIIPAAGVTTLIMFGGLTAVVFVTKRDFSFMGAALGICSLAGLALIVVSILFGFNLGIWFSALMVVMACGYILYYTSNIMRTYRTDQYVAAALALFASVALLFWYILRIFMSLSDRR
jgi:FtsH-binding integral membrane protein